MIDLKLFRTKNKFTQLDTASYFGCTQSFISQIEKGERPIPEDYISKIKADENLLWKPDYILEQKRSDHSESITMPREVFDQISRLTETILSQQRTIENLTETNKKIVVQKGSNASVADVG